MKDAKANPLAESKIVPTSSLWKKVVGRHFRSKAPVDERVFCGFENEKLEQYQKEKDLVGTRIDNLVQDAIALQEAGLLVELRLGVGTRLSYGFGIPSVLHEHGIRCRLTSNPHSCLFRRMIWADIGIRAPENFPAQMIWEDICVPAMRKFNE